MNNVKLESLFEALDLISKLHPESLTAQRMSCRNQSGGYFSEDEFLKRIILPNRPVVVTDLMRDWPARAWTHQQFIARFGHLEVQVQTGRDTDPDFEVRSSVHRNPMRFDDFLTRIIASRTNDLYLTANNEFLKRPEFAPLLDELAPLPPWMVSDGLRHSSWLWIGADGAHTPLHHDKTVLFHAQIVGAKRWRLASPFAGRKLDNYTGVFSRNDLSDKAEMANRGIGVIDVTINPGEALYLPMGWWHQVDSIGAGISLSIANFKFQSSFHIAEPG